MWGYGGDVAVPDLFAPIGHLMGNPTSGLGQRLLAIRRGNSCRYCQTYALSSDMPVVPHKTLGFGTHVSRSDPNADRICTGQRAQKVNRPIR
jgi:hypothetical protein